MTDFASTPESGATQAPSREQAALTKVFGKDFAKTFGSPFTCLYDFSLTCPVSARFFRKDFPYLSKQMFLEYHYRTWRGFNQELVDRYAEMITTKLANIKIMMTNTVTRLQTIMDQQGHKPVTLWPQQVIQDIPVIAFHVRPYMEVLGLLEKIYIMTGSGNLYGVIDSKQRAEAEAQAKKAVRAFRSVMQNEVVKLYREAQRVMAAQRGEGKLTEQVAAFVKQQGEDIAEFERDAKNEDREEDLLQGADPAQLIDEQTLASQVGLAAIASGKKPRAKPKADGASGEAAPATPPAPVTSGDVTTPVAAG